MVQPTCACLALEEAASSARSCVLSTPVSRNLRLRWNVLMAATVLSVHSPLIRPLYSPVQARSNWMAMRSASDSELSRGWVGGGVGPFLRAAAAVRMLVAAWARRVAARAAGRRNLPAVAAGLAVAAGCALGCADGLSIWAVTGSAVASRMRAAATSLMEIPAPL